MKALILSGGMGTRLRPLTYTNAKQLIPIANKPILFYIIEKVARAGIKDIGIIVGDTRDEIMAAAGNGERWSVNITYIYQPLPLGLAHAVKTAADFIQNSDFLMVLGDNLFSMELDGFISMFSQTGSNAALLLYKVQNPSQFGVAVVEDGKIIKLVEKPKVFISDLIITGVYLFDKSIFSAIDKTKPSERGELEITDAVQILLEQGGKVTYDITENWWKDTGKLHDIIIANQLVLDEITDEADCIRDESSWLTGKVQTGKGVRIVNSTIRGPAAIGDNTIIVDSYVGPYTSLGKNINIRNCELENSIILDNVILENVQSRIDSSLIGKNAKIKGRSLRPNTNCFLIAENSEIYM